MTRPKTNPHPRRAPRKKLPVVFIGDPPAFTTDPLPALALHHECCRQRGACVKCALFWAAETGGEFGRLMKRAGALGATRRELCAVAVALMAEEVQ